MSGTKTMMAERSWDPYFEGSIEKDRDPVLDDPIIYGNDVKHLNVTVYSQTGRVQKYWNARILKDLCGYCRIACPRDGKILNFNWFEWKVYMFSQSGMNELIFMPDSGIHNVASLSKEVK